MLNTLHKQVLAAKLADMLVSCPLVMVYQIIGNVRSPQVASSMQKHLDQALPGHGVRATCIKMKNSVAAFSQDVEVSTYLRANNILVGWKVPEASLLSQLTAKPTTKLHTLIAGRSVQPVTQLQQPSQPASQHSSSARTQQRPRLPHKVLVPAIQHSLKLQEQMPVALLASFYRGQQVTLKDLKQWIQLDEMTVMGELIAELDAVGQQLVDAQSVGDSLLGALDATEPQELLYLLDHRSPQEAGPVHQAA